LAALEQRYAAFIEKLVGRGAALVAAVLPQIHELMSGPGGDTETLVDQVKTAATRQLASLNDKAYKVYTDQIVRPEGTYTPESLYAFRGACYGQFAALEALIRVWREEIDEAARPDYEAELQKIQIEFESTKGLYRCGQCGAVLPLERIFFTDLYLPCAKCGIQNHLLPSAGARRLDFIARPLAERRHAAELEASHLPRQQAIALEYKWRAEIGSAEAGDPAAKTDVQQLCVQMVELNTQAEHEILGYLDGIYAEMTDLVPDNVVQYQRQHQQDAAMYLAGVLDDRTRIDKIVRRTRQLN